MDKITTMPQNIEAERSVLGSILLDESKLPLVSELRSKDFYEDKHAIIYDAILKLDSKRSDIDSLTVTNYLESNDKLSEIGGASYLTELIESVPTSTHAEEYASIVKDKSLMRSIIKAGHGISTLGMNEGISVQEILEGSFNELNAITERSVGSKFDIMADLTDQEADRIELANDKDQYVHGISTGYKTLDEKLGGIDPGDLVIVAARPSHGKSTFALNLADNADKNGLKVGIISLEMSKFQVYSKLVSRNLFINSMYIKTGELWDSNLKKWREGKDKMRDMNIVIDDKSDATLASIRASVYSQKASKGLDLLIIDYLQLMLATRGKNNRVEEISEISRGLKILARELEIPIIALSQLSRAVEMRPDQRPRLSDLRESGSIEQDADKVLMIWYDKEKNPGDESLEDRTTVNVDMLITKNRMGQTGSMLFKFHKKYSNFVESEYEKLKRELDAQDITDEINKQL